MFTLYYAQLFTGSTKMFNSSNLLNCVLFPIVKPNYSKLNRQLENKVIVITGASYGIGESLVNLLANIQCHLILVDQVITTLGKILFNLYGTSEAGICMIASPDDLSIKPETIGKPLRGLSTKLLKQNNESQKHHELFIKCAWSTVGNHWVSTGDLVYQDADGYYFLAGRVDDMIVSGGENVYPYELEHCLSTHPEINDVTVISVPDEEFGQRLVAFIVLNPNTEQSETKIQDWLKSKIARYQMPKKIIFIDELPMTSIGKIDRKKLQQLFFTHLSNV